MRQAICAALFLLVGQAVAEPINLMDTSGGAAVPSPAISFVPEDSSAPPAAGVPAAPRNRKHSYVQSGKRSHTAQAALQPAASAPSPD